MYKRQDYDWTFFKDNLKEGEIFTIQPDKNSTDVIISKYLSDLLGLKVGDSFLTYFVQDDVRARKFTITGIYETGFLDYDKMFVIADIKQIRRLNGWDKAVSYTHLDVYKRQLRRIMLII